MLGSKYGVPSSLTRFPSLSTGFPKLSLKPVILVSSLLKNVAVTLGSGYPTVVIPVVASTASITPLLLTLPVVPSANNTCVPGG